MTNRNQSELVPLLNLASRQSLSNKFRENRWSAKDLTEVADLCGCRLAFLFPNGDVVYVGQDVDERKESPDA